MVDTLLVPPFDKSLLKLDFSMNGTTQILGTCTHKEPDTGEGEAGGGGVGYDLKSTSSLSLCRWI